MPDFGVIKSRSFGLSIEAACHLHRDNDWCRIRLYKYLSGRDGHFSVCPYYTAPA